ncbi:MAG: hypothetical protein ACFFEJ_00020 [Candidatus Thorarchaeota archaeon]
MKLAHSVWLVAHALCINITDANVAAVQCRAARCLKEGSTILTSHPIETRLLWWANLDVSISKGSAHLKAAIVKGLEISPSFFEPRHYITDCLTLVQQTPIAPDPRSAV